MLNIQPLCVIHQPITPCYHCLQHRDWKLEVPQSVQDVLICCSLERQFPSALRRQRREAGKVLKMLKSICSRLRVLKFALPPLDFISRVDSITTIPADICFQDTGKKWYSSRQTPLPVQGPGRNTAVYHIMLAA